VRSIGGAFAFRHFNAQIMNNRARGAAGEDAAVDFLRGKGYRILERNFRFQRGEIDIVAELGDQLVFVEVKARHTKLYGDPEDAITSAKCRQLWNVAQGYLSRRRIEEQSWRFDVVA